MAISLVFFVILVALLAIPVLGMVVAIIGFPVLAAGMVQGCAAQARGEPLKVDHLFAGLRVPRRPPRPGRLLLPCSARWSPGVLPALLGGLLLTGLFYTELHSLSWLAVVLGSAAFATGIIITIMTDHDHRPVVRHPAGGPQGHPAP